ncbi:LON peptidase substrate-binding domain-containing protein [Leptospira noguchii]|uniref:ATP-dependent protease La (LON) domain protein n=3 Tax=Leptospira noguchii TaxID=28182 RepID=M6UXU5_9LEPT|nr:LON peptidase substrate-binding domain-containing protein [Leptospira noguchii]EKR72899.1 ATP-dependent protease La (LON) domain protein [Leptospira noguchii str. 2006001870]EMN00135.1 ATP-dependent protease La (LON) domain protein [Leptospira noguchii str. 2007001578]EMO42123.1 ATP-dependent protease La (LON) domain protein [Leptospira noguchii serovar Autumnalis str. ZUN142]EMS87849.1 ATP-dependent protease La (LON) domain protein [Leptospira noguchii str. Hook]TQE77765.1 ATP-dependent Lo
MLPVSITTVPIFPLPEIILFPGTYLPLHIFEPRYRLMLDYCMESSEELAIAPLLSKSKMLSLHPEIETVFGWGKIVRRDPLPDGRSNILLEGKGIAKLIDYETMEPFRVGKVEKIEPNFEYLKHENFKKGFERLLFLTKRILLSEGAGEDLILRMNELMTHPFPIDFIASILNFEFSKKQEILVDPNPMEKMKILMRIAEELNLRE